MSGRSLHAIRGRFDGGDLAAEQLLRVAERAELPVSQFRNWDLIHSGDEHYSRILHEISHAEQEISLEMYQICPDTVGQQVCAALAEAAVRGLRVRLLLDRFGSRRISAWIPELVSKGVEFRWYNPWKSARWPFLRTHRKLILVDSKRASIGGFNVTASFSESGSGKRAWRDVGLWFEGPAVSLLASQFEHTWLDQGGSPKRFRPLVAGGSLCAVAGGEYGRDGHAAAISALIESASQELVMATPYFIPNAALRRRLIGAVRRGVRVVVVVPRLSDITPFKHASRHLYSSLLNEGVEIRERCDRMVHAKVAVADRRLGALGSVNLNRQSMYNNSETLLLTIEPAIVRQLRALIVDEGAPAIESLSRSGWRRHPDRRRWAELVAAPVGLVF
jgi:cardiolipin synthase